MLRSYIYILLVAVASSSCREGRRDAALPEHSAVLVYLAASLTRPLAAALDTFAARNNIAVQRESGASLEHARKLTDLGRTPDLLVLADPEVFPQLLMPKHVGWYAEFARNRMVIAYTDRSRDAAKLDSVSWPTILARRHVEVGRSDPDLAPVGYRTLLVLKLAEQYYHRPGLGASILANAPPRNMRPNAAELATLLQAGELDYIFDYESVAATYGLHALNLPAAIDLGDPAHAQDYASVTVQVKGRGGDSVTFAGTPILYALSVPRAAPHPMPAARLAEFLLSAEGRHMMRDAHVDALDHAIFVGSDVPSALRDAAGR